MNSLENNSYAARAHALMFVEEAAQNERLTLLARQALGFKTRLVRRPLLTATLGMKLLPLPKHVMPRHYLRDPANFVGVGSEAIVMAHSEANVAKFFTYPSVKKSIREQWIDTNERTQERLQQLLGDIVVPHAFSSLEAPFSKPIGAMVAATQERVSQPIGSINDLLRTERPIPSWLTDYPSIQQEIAAVAVGMAVLRDEDDAQLDLFSYKNLLVTTDADDQARLQLVDIGLLNLGATELSMKGALSTLDVARVDNWVTAIETYC